MKWKEMKRNKLVYDELFSWTTRSEKEMKQNWSNFKRNKKKFKETY